MKSIAKNKSKGITLIALVVTIVVLLILAGITINYVLGEDGILAQAKLAAERTKIEEYRTVLELIRAGLETDKILEDLGTEEFLTRYEERAKNEEANGALKGSTIKGPQEDMNDKVQVTTKEGYVFEITEKEVKYRGKIDELPKAPDLTQADIEIHLNPATQTKEVVKATITLKNPNSEYTLQYAKKNKNEKTEDGDWAKYEEGTEITFEQNGLIFARLINDLGKAGAEASGDVSNIDKLDPKEFDATAEPEANTVIVKGHTEDEEGNDQYSKSKIKEYYFKNITDFEKDTDQIENAIGWVGKVEVTEENTGNDVNYTFTGLKPATQYTFVMKAVDEAGNERISNPVKISTKEKEVTNVTVTPTEATIKVDEQVQLTASIEPTDATNQKLTWKAEPSDAVLIETSTDGKTATITGKIAESVTVTVESQADANKKATCTITVNPNGIAVTELKFGDYVYYTLKGGTKQLCQVIYEKDENGPVEIMPIDVLGSVTLGYDDPNAQDATGDDLEFARTLKSWELSEETLTNEARKYENESFSPKDSTRAFGSYRSELTREVGPYVDFAERSSDLL